VFINHQKGRNSVNKAAGTIRSKWLLISLWTTFVGLEPSINGSHRLHFIVVDVLGTMFCRPLPNLYCDNCIWLDHTKSVASMAAVAAPMSQVFVYGTLMWPSILSTLLGRVPKAQAAALDGVHRLKVKSQVYPAAVDFIRDDASSARAVIHGLILEVNAEELVLLDDYEDDEYELKPVHPRLVTTTAVPLISKSDNGVFAWATLTPAIGWEETVSAETVPASAYVWREEHASKLVLDTSDPWTPEYFGEN